MAWSVGEGNRERDRQIALSKNAAYQTLIQIDQRIAIIDAAEAGKEFALPAQELIRLMRDTIEKWGAFRSMREAAIKDAAMAHLLSYKVQRMKGSKAD
jgi:hypothetical protein